MCKKRNPKVKSIYCMINRQALVSKKKKKIPAPLGKVLDQTIETVNFVKGGAFNSLFFKQLCIDMDAGHHLLLFNIKIRWLSKGITTERIFALRDELKLPFKVQGKVEFLSGWMMRRGLCALLILLIFLRSLIN